MSGKWSKHDVYKYTDISKSMQRVKFLQYIEAQLVPINTSMSWFCICGKRDVQIISSVIQFPFLCKSDRPIYQTRIEYGIMPFEYSIFIPEASDNEYIGKDVKIHVFILCLYGYVRCDC